MLGAAFEGRGARRVSRLRGLRWRLIFAAAHLRLLALRLGPRPVGAVLMYHRVEPRQGDPAAEFTPPVSCALFAEQLDWARRRFAPVEARDIQRAAAARRRGQRIPLAVTFDDDTISHVRHAAPLLAERGVPATFFLNGMALDGPRAYWWERLQAARDAGRPWADLLPAAALEEARRRAGDGALEAYHVSEAVERLPVAERAALSERWRALLGGDPPESGLRREQVRELAARGFAIGFHGARHEPLSLLDDGAMRAELDDGREEVAVAAGAPLELIAYPHGKAGPREAAAAAERGFAHGFTVLEEAVTPEADPLLLGRVDAQVPSVGSLAAALARALRGPGTRAAA